MPTVTAALPAGTLTKATAKVAGMGMAPGDDSFDMYRSVLKAETQCQSETFALPISQWHESLTKAFRTP